MHALTRSELDNLIAQASVGGLGPLALADWLAATRIVSQATCGRLAGVGGLGAEEGVWLLDAGAVPTAARLAAERVCYAGQPVALLAARTPEMLSRARQAVSVRCDADEPIDCIETALAARQQLFAPDNVYQRFELEAGDVTAAFPSAHRFVEHKFRVEFPPVSLASPTTWAIPVAGGGYTVLIEGLDPDDRDSRLGERLMEWCEDAGRVECLAVGNGRRPREAVLTDALHALLLATRSGRAVRFEPSAPHDPSLSVRYHPGIIRHRSGFDADQRLVARDVMVLLDGGAERTRSVDVLLAAFLHAPGLYACPNVRVRGRVLATNRPPSGTPFGDGVLQVSLGVELHMAYAARTLGCAGSELRARNLLREGDALVTGQRAALVGSVADVVTSLDADESAALALAYVAPAWCISNRDQTQPSDWQVGELGALSLSGTAPSVVDLVGAAAAFDAGLGQAGAMRVWSARSAELSRAWNAIELALPSGSVGELVHEVLTPSAGASDERACGDAAVAAATAAASVVHHSAGAEILSLPA